jgi:hypothetical protein
MVVLNERDGYESQSFDWGPGFPQDDEHSMGQGTPNSTADLSIWYAEEYNPDEPIDFDWREEGF